ncbi:hypothetical protein [Nostocoides sp. HKS02]|uniref:hypothetical protein n=1 Tax=Nostocoides sp. HKS02 TaxID=1813880 RepID=UPI0012B478E7|nr:hypothetical protein [Tetrasphaera sp. HKS02]QGN58859.1 hypothetical protein GKE56_14300 [Tetrasphaera sp. HKS02]
MRKFIAVLTALLVLPFALSACGPTNSPVKAEKAVSLNGTWKADGLEAVIAENSVEIHIVDKDTSSLYWKGTFPTGSDTVTSVADKEALSSSMLGSQDAEKVFTIKDNEITFKMSMLGTTKTIHLKK